MLTVDQLKLNLSKQYDIVLFADLADAIDQHGSAYRLLKSIHQLKFQPNQRIIFYSSHEPNQLIIDHLQLAVAKIDISNWFITIYSPHDITDKLVQANKKYGFDDHAIQWSLIDLESTKRLDYDKLHDNKHLCFLPFNSIDLHYGLNAKPCCKYRKSIGDASTQTLKEIMSGDEVKQLREQFRKGIKPTGCQYCWNLEDSGNVSLRQHFLSRFRDDGDLYHVDNPQVRHVSISPGITCNFKCRICSSNDSSAIAAEDIKFSNNLDEKNRLMLYIKNNASVDLDIYSKMFDPILPTLESLHILGGEPLLIKNLLGLVDYIIETGHHTHIQLNIQSNGSTWSDHFISQAIKFQKVEVLLSIDDLGNRFEIQRGGSWTEVDNNIKRWASYKTDNFIIKISPTVNIQNVLYLDQLIDYCDSNQLDIVWTYLESPKSLCIDNMTKHAKKLVYQKYHNHHNSELQSIATRMLDHTTTDGTEFINLMTMFDRRRNVNFQLSHLEIFNAMLKR